MKVLKFRRIRDCLACILLAVFVVSTFSNYYLVNKIGFCAIEIVLIPLLLLYNRFLSKIKGTDIALSLSIIFVLWVLSYAFLNPIQFSTISSTVRSYLIFFLSFFLFMRNEINDTAFENVYWVVLVSKIADLAGAVAGLQMSVLMDSNSVISSINILTTPIIIAYSYRCKGMVHFMLVCLLCLITSFFSATRGIILYTVINILFCILLKQLSLMNFLKKLCAVGALSFLLVSVYFASENYVKDYSPNLHYRMYRKVLEHDDVVTGDKDREEHYYYLLEHIDEVLFPHGMATRSSDTVQISSNRILWSIRDSSFVEIVYTFGIFSLILFFYLIKITMFYIKRKDYNVANFVLAMCLINLIICIPMGYGLLITPPHYFCFRG